MCRDPPGPSNHAKARYFDPKLGRFLTQDSFLGQIDEPPSLHRYLYANANPTFYTDPTGNYSWSEFNSDARWGKDFIVAFGSDLAQNAPERALKINDSIGSHAANLVTETGANIHDAAVLGYEAATGSETGVQLRSSVAQAAGQAIASGDPLAHLDVTQQIGIDAAANIATFGIYGTAQQQYGALRDFSQGKASIADVESRLADAAGGSVVNLGLTAAFLKGTTGSVKGPDLGATAKTVVESASQLPSRVRAAAKGGLDRLHEAIGENSFTTLGRIEPPGVGRPAQISSVGRGYGGHAVIDRIAGEAQGAMGQAGRILESGGANTRWAQIYQRLRGSGRDLEFFARRNALHQEAEAMMLRNRYVQEAIDSGYQVTFNQGSALGIRGPRGGLVRPDIQIGLPDGRWGIVDWTTPGSAPKIFKYATPETRFLVNVVKR